MGNASSNPDDYHDDEENHDPFDGIDTLGYRVLGVQPNSPASAAGLVSFLDFLVGAEDKMLLGSGEGLEPGDEYDDVDLPALLNEYKGKEMEFLVWNIKSQQARLVKLTPSDSWGGAGLLGVTIRLDNYAGAENRLVRVLTVEPQSPAAVAGLVPEKDFLLGTTHQTLESTTQLAQVLRQHQDQVVELYVYNADSDMVRVVALMPTLTWGGMGLLGAEVGTGYLHRLPATSRNTEGVSVERKVRYVGMAPPTPTNAGNNKQQSAVVELEPQLEMEPSEHHDEEDEASIEEVEVIKSQENAGRKEVSSEAQSGKSETSESAPSEKSQVENTADVQDTNDLPNNDDATKDTKDPPPQDNNKDAKDPPQPEDNKHAKDPPPAQDNSKDVKDPPVPANGTASSSEAVASSLFSQPPRLYAPPASSMLPPPPTMHFESPTKVSQ